jgi:ADP-ribose pyrophosphatase YjhB (NUDIX family)
MRRLIRFLAFLTKAKFTAGSIVGVFNRQDQILLVKNRYRERARYSLPGGFRKYRESATRTAQRELSEEINLELELPDFVFVAHYQQRWAAHFDYLFAVKLAMNVVPQASRLREIRLAEWHDLNHLPPLNRAAQLAIPKLVAWRVGSDPIDGNV